MPLLNDITTGAAVDLAADPTGIGSIPNTFISDFGSRIGFGSGNFGFVSDANHATDLYDGKAPFMQNNAPRFKFQFFVMINMRQTVDAQDFTKRFMNKVQHGHTEQIIKQVDMPSMNIETEILNQYNKKRISQKKINFQPVNLVMHDVADGKSLRFWEMYYEYYFKDGVNFDQDYTTNDPNNPRNQMSQVYASGKLGSKKDDRIHKPLEFVDDTVQDKFKSSFGYNLDEIADEKYLIDSIDIYQVHGGTFQKVRLVHPRISAFKHDTLAQDGTDFAELTFTFEYEDAIYTNYAENLNTREMARFVNQHFMEIDSLAKPKPPIEQLKRDIAEPANLGIGQVTGDKSVLGNFQKNLAGLVGDLPDQYIKAATSSIFNGGEVKWPDPKSALKNIARNGATNTKGAVAGSFASTAKQGVNVFVDSVRGAFGGSDSDGGGDG